MGSKARTRPAPGGKGSNQYSSKPGNSPASSSRADASALTAQLAQMDPADALMLTELPWLPDADRDAWREAGFSAHHAAQYLRAGVHSPTHAAGWRDADFGPEQVQSWRAQDGFTHDDQNDPEFDPWVEATLWRNHGFSPAQAAHFRRLGHTPESASNVRGEGWLP